MDPTKLPPTHNLPESPTGVYFLLHSLDGMRRIACPCGVGVAILQARAWLRKPGAYKIQIWAGPPENPHAHLLCTDFAANYTMAELTGQD